MDPIVGIIESVVQERAYQDRKWGGTTHDDENEQDHWHTYIKEYAAGKSERTQHYPLGVRLVKSTALAVAAIESGDRRRDWPAKTAKEIIVEANSTMTIADEIDLKSYDSAIIIGLLRHLGKPEAPPRMFRQQMLCVIAYCTRVLLLRSPTPA